VQLKLIRAPLLRKRDFGPLASRGRQC